VIPSERRRLWVVIGWLVLAAHRQAHRARALLLVVDGVTDSEIARWSEAWRSWAPSGNRGSRPRASLRSAVFAPVGAGGPRRSGESAKRVPRSYLTRVSRATMLEHTLSRPRGALACGWVQYGRYT